MSVRCRRGAGPVARGQGGRYLSRGRDGGDQDDGRVAHNTPAIARDSYINPRVIELFEKGTVISGKATDTKVRALLT